MPPLPRALLRRAAPNGPFTLKDEMLGARTFLNETCGIPLEVRCAAPR